MSYETNPRLPHIRMQAVRMVESGKSVREVALHFGYSHSAVVQWCKRARVLPHGLHTIPTVSSRPHSHPDALSKEIVHAIIEYRLKHRRCAEVIHHLLVKDGYEVSLSSVKRTLKRQGMTKYSPWKKWHTYNERPLPEKPGILVQIDTVLDGVSDDRLYVYTMIDVCSRWAYADVTPRINTHASWRFLKKAREALPFDIQMIQSDHGSEFSKHFSKQCIANDIQHRHSRVRRPTDNGHLERFNRTIQEECLNRTVRSYKHWQKAIPEYLRFYNTERPHMSLKMQSPEEWLQGIG